MGHIKQMPSGSENMVSSVRRTSGNIGDKKCYYYSIFTSHYGVLEHYCVSISSAYCTFNVNESPSVIKELTLRES